MTSSQSGMNHTTDRITWVLEGDPDTIDGALVSIGSLSRADSEAITGEQGSVLLVCYVDPEVLRHIAEDNGQLPSEVLRERFLPDAPPIKVGDFGEVYAREALEGRDDGLVFPGFRWRNKAYKNDTVRGPDLIGFKLQADSEHASRQDTLVLVEAKTRSTRDARVAEKALTDAVKHSGSRLADALFTLQASLRELGLEDEAKALARFTKPHPTPYKRRLIPAVVIATNVWREDFLDGLVVAPTADSELELVVLTIDDLAPWIDEVHCAASAAADE